MESQTGENMVALIENMERMEVRLEAAASLLERTAAQMEERESERSGEVRRIVAAVETSREAELQKKLEAAEQQIAELRAQMESNPEPKPEPKSARRTVPASTVQFLAKQGIASLESVEAGALDAALNGLSLEQRIAVKAQLLRAGVVG
jgi:exonuclease VII small subunit